MLSSKLPHNLSFSSFHFQFPFFFTFSLPPPSPYISFPPSGRDVIAQAQSGTGKTATFAISILQAVDMSKKSCQALVLAPTRELAQQIQKVVGVVFNTACPGSCGEE